MHRPAGTLGKDTMAATIHNIQADRGGTVTVTVAVVESDGSASNLTGYTGSMQARLDADDATAVMTGTVTIAAPTTGVVVGTFAASDTAVADWSAAVYDLRITSGSVVEYLVAGTIELRSSVTR